MNYRKDIQEIMEYITHNNDEDELRVSYAELARRYNCDYRTIKNAINRIKNGAPKRTNSLTKSILNDYLNINVKVPKKGEKLRLVEMASDNAKIALNEKFELIKKDEEKTD